MNKTAIKNFAIWARNKLIADISYRAGLMGITEKGIADALPQSTGDTDFYDIGAAQPYSITGEAIRQRKKLVEVIRTKEKDTDYQTAYRYIMEEVAYTWFNRLIAVRFIEVNDYLPSHIRVLSSESGKLEPDLVTTPFDADLSFTQAEEAALVQLRQDNKLDEAFRLLFIKQCNALNEILPALFEKTKDYTELLLNLSVIDQEGVVYHLVHDIPEDDFNIDRGGQVEIIGWLYQYYNTEPKAAAFAKKEKITKEEIPAVTQLFTPDWIVRYMVENSLGRLWLEGHPDSTLKKNWKYYLDEAPQEPEVQVRLAEIRREYAVLTPEDIKLIDPCMGSGHILVYAFDVLMQIYTSVGYSERDAARSILEHNLYGLDIDDRAYQLAYFAVMMKARQYNRRILNGENTCHVYAIQESNTVNRVQLKYFGAGLNDLEKNLATMQIGGLLDTLTDAKEYGSILNVENYNWELLRQFVAGMDIGTQINMDSYGVEDTAEQLMQLIDIGETMAQKYWVTVTNPPYRAVADCGDKLNTFAKGNYPDSKNDLSTIFMEKTLGMCKPYGYMAMINIPVWMSKSSFEQLRYKLLALHTISVMAHCGRGIFGSDFGTTAFVVQNAHITKYRALFRQLFNELGAVDSVEQKEKWFFEEKGIYYAYPDKFLKIASYPIAYWVSDRLLTVLNECKPLNDFAAPRKGLTTGDNDTFVRLWFEITSKKFAVHDNMPSKWSPMTKGGDFRRWYGNNSYVVNWENDGYELKNFKDSSGKLRSVLRNTQFYFKECISWNDTTATGKIAFRYQTNEFIPNASGPCVYANKNLWYLFGLLNSKVSQVLLEILAPNMKFEVGQMGLVPIILETRPDVEELVHDTVREEKADWDSFETSWDFIRHPLLKAITKHPNQMKTGSIYLSECYDIWAAECEERFARLKTNEEELNRIFIEIYGLQDELTPEVEDQDVTVRKADLQHDIKSLISYAVGCMFGRYSLDRDGLVYAGGSWEDKFDSYTGSFQDLQDYTWGELGGLRVTYGKAGSKFYYLKGTGKRALESFPVDYDNVIPITDEEFFDDDIISRFCDWMKYAYGADTLEANLDFIAKALGNKGNTSREIIRNYFLNDFFKDHCLTYSVTGSGKRPIYWLFDSGKQNGFKALIYLHRYTPDTIGNLRIDYLHKMQRVYESEMERMQDMIDHSTNASEAAAATKRKDKLARQLKECRDYDEKIGHLALSRIELDLDDGVKVNYRKLQTAYDGKFYEVLADSNKIMADDKLWTAYRTEWPH
ncbi:putative uncharacterized protein [Firmicutes bacterium CAG:791]|nr:putative uncharacterized protein [Firmicutes bacterium CAG:791]